jgi:hypothetical protein
MSVLLPSKAFELKKKESKSVKDNPEKKTPGSHIIFPKESSGSSVLSVALSKKIGTTHDSWG